MMGHSVATVIVNWNKEQDILNCLRRVYRSSIQPQEIIVVDNASTDASVSKIRYHFPDVTILEQETNLGGTGGFNTGIRYALSQNYDFIWCLDNDALPARHFLRHALAAFEDEQIGMVGAQILDIAHPTQTVELGAYINWHTQGTRANFRAKPRVKPKQSFAVDYVPVCCALIRSQAIQTVGLMDTAYFLHWDDMDWGWRFNQAGYKVIASASALAWHKMYGMGESPLVVQYYDQRNALYFYAKHASGILKIYLMIFGLGKRALALVKNIILLRPDRLRMNRDATLDFLMKRMGKNQRAGYYS